MKLNLHNAMWPGIVGKGPGSDEDTISLDRMIELTSNTNVTEQHFDGIDLILAAPHIDIHASESDIIKFTEIYSFSKIENGIAFIKTTSNIDQEIKMQNRYPIKMKGIQKGGIEVEEKTGFLLNKESNISLKGNLKTKNINIELSISLYKKIKGKKL